MPRRPDMPCALCGSLIWRGTGSLPEGEAMCRPCRRVVSISAPRRSDYRTPCVTCGGPAYGVHCRACADDAKLNVWQKIVRHEDDPHTQRCRREQAAPGLTSTQRSKLLRMWKRQGRRCTYCSNVADTVDHVVPLIRGGTNYEGNLTPCCRRCNGSKGGYMVAEWRHGKRLPPRTEPLPWRGNARRHAKRKVKVGPQLALIPLGEVWRRKPKAPAQCPKCNAVFYTHKGTYCSKRCHPATLSGAQQRKRRRERNPGGPIAA